TEVVFVARREWKTEGGRVCMFFGEKKGRRRGKEKREEEIGKTGVRRCSALVVLAGSEGGKKEDGGIGGVRPDGEVGENVFQQ
ncbi:hypothetical protein HAX54_040834, partial [Datura stramonium]|nr:hypothetical protein [Datura stramonium]